MIARLQRVLTLGLLFVAVAAAIAFYRIGHASWALMVVSLVAFGHAVVLGVEFILLVFVTRALPGCQSDANVELRALLAAWLAESVHALRAFCWRQPFCPQKWPDRLPLEPGLQRGVILVHGLLCNRGFWNPWLAKFTAHGAPFIAMNLEPIAGLIEDDLAAIDAAVTTMTRLTGQAPLLVGHSRGGLVLRAWAAEPGRVGRYHHIVTIGSPHGGTWMARFALSRGSAEMRLNSAWLANLRARECASAYAKFTCFFSRCDNLVFPALTATLPGAQNLEVPASAHIQMAFAPAVFAEGERLAGRNQPLDGWPTRATSTRRHQLMGDGGPLTAEVQRWLVTDRLPASARANLVDGGGQQVLSLANRASGASSGASQI